MSRNNSSSEVPPAYDFQRRDEDEANAAGGLTNYNASSDGVSGDADSEGYIDIHTAAGDSTVGTAAHIHLNQMEGEHQDATAAVAEMHLALLYLLSNPHEFERAVHHPTAVTTTLQQWNSEYYDDQSLYTEAESVSVAISPSNTAAHHHNEKNNSPSYDSSSNSNNTSTPLPFAIFCDDAEVVLPQAHTASQLFGIETVTGMELEAAAGVPAVSQLFLRWLALMPGGDHLNLIDPPGLTVMRIAGGRYRVTAAHRVVWTWYNEFAAVSETATALNALQPGDLVSLTVVDVFETDNQGKLLSYCPTFDNRAVHKTDRTAHALRKKSTQIGSALKTAQNSKLARSIGRHAANLARTLRHAVDDAVHQYQHTNHNKEEEGETPQQQHLTSPPEPNVTAAAAVAATTMMQPPSSPTTAAGDNAQRLQQQQQQQHESVAGTSTYQADDDTERHEI